MITVYSVLKESGIKFTPQQIMQIGDTVKMAYYMDFSKNPAQGEQDENGKILTVNVYPDDFKERIEKIIIRFYEKMMEEPHKKYNRQEGIGIAKEP